MTTTAERVKFFDERMYESKYIQEDIERYVKLWTLVRTQKDVLESAAEVIVNKFGIKKFNSNSIVEAMLYYYNDVPEDIFKKIIDSIYSETELAKIILNGSSNNGYSLLLLSLYNDRLVLSEEQKQFAINQGCLRSTGVNYYDIRYWILNNLNFANEFKDLVYMFYKTDEEYYGLIEYLNTRAINRLEDNLEEFEQDRIFINRLLSCRSAKVKKM